MIGSQNHRSRPTVFTPLFFIVSWSSNLDFRRVQWDGVRWPVLSQCVRGVASAPVLYVRLEPDPPVPSRAICVPCVGSRPVTLSKETRPETNTCSRETLSLPLVDVVSSCSRPLLLWSSRHTSASATPPESFVTRPEPLIDLSLPLLPGDLWMWRITTSGLDVPSGV